MNFLRNSHISFEAKSLGVVSIDKKGNASNSHNIIWSSMALLDVALKCHRSVSTMQFF